MKLMLPAMLGVIMFFIFDLGISCLPSASRTLRQANLLTCKLSKIPDPAQFLTVIFEVSVEDYAGFLLDRPCRRKGAAPETDLGEFCREFDSACIYQCYAG